VLAAARDGGTISDVARSLHLSDGTTRNHLSSAMQKLEARTRADAARIARSAAGCSDGLGRHRSGSGPTHPHSAP
jgi:DNA-binding NarL/FixJ family response regulator